ncbi:prephenate dehydratase [Dehalococcoidia bacterium]|nr:prephenate dehydratase [Dehalococcoidia bacterium]
MTIERVAYLGPAGSFTEGAALHFTSQAGLVPCSTVAAVSIAVGTGMAEVGVVPIENSLEGSVNDTLDLLIHESSLFIRQELVLPIQHCLLVRPDTKESDIEVIYSHPQALGQCRQFLETHFPAANAVAALSTSAAVEQLHRSQERAAAIGTMRAAHLYDMEILAKGIQDNQSNATRFVVLGHSDHPRTGDDKTSLCFSFEEDRPGLLYNIMGEFASRKINLAKIESRPTKKGLGRYIFLVDMDGHRDDPLVNETIESLRARASMLKIFGSYPRYSTTV